MTRTKKRRERVEKLLLSEVQLLFVEKQTYHAILRTTLGIITVPLTIIAFLVGTTEFHSVFDRALLGYVVLGGLLLVSIGGIFILAKVHLKIKKLNDIIEQVEREDERIDQIVV